MNGKEKLASDIVEEAQRMNVREMIEPMIKGSRIKGAPLPGYRDTGDVPADELRESATAKADPELWWCRTIAKRLKLSVTYMDWYWYNSQDSGFSN